MNKLNTILVDDEQEALDSLEILLSDFEQIQILKKIQNPLDVFAAIINLKPNLLFLDIKMPNISGIDLLAKIREFNPSIIIIIVTAFENYSGMAIKHNAFDYLMKPVNRMELKSTIEKVQRYSSEIIPNSIQRVLINSRNETILLNPDDVAFLRAEGQYTHIILQSGKTIFTSSNMGSLMKRFPQNQFLKANRSVSVNKNRILSVSRKNKTCTIQLADKEDIIEVSSVFLKEFQSVFTNE